METPKSSLSSENERQHPLKDSFRRNGKNDVSFCHITAYETMNIVPIVKLQRRPT